MNIPTTQYKGILLWKLVNVQVNTGIVMLIKEKRGCFLQGLSIKLTLKWWKVEPNGRKWGATVMLMGEYNHTIDAKGRLIVPAKFREVLGDEFVVTKGLDNCLFVYPNDEWQKFEEKLQTLPLTNKNARQFTRFFLAGSASVEVYKQGRILLPSVLREFAGLEKDVVLVGVASRIEIWSKDRWTESISTYDDDMDEVAANMESLGFSI